MKQKDHAVLITGGSKRIGLALATATLSMGYTVIIHYHGSPEPARKYVQSRPELATRCIFIGCDLNNRPEELIDAVVSLPVNLVGLVNNASLFMPGNLDNQAQLAEVLSINAFAPLRLARRFAGKVRKGWIVNITDANLKPVNERYQNYRVSKLFLEEFTRQLAFLLAPDIRVNSLAPGAVLPSENGDKLYFSRLAKKIPLRRTGDIASLCHAYEFLVRNEYTTGITLPIDGGRHLVA